MTDSMSFVEDTVAMLRKAGYAVVIVSPEQLDGYPPAELESDLNAAITTVLMLHGGNVSGACDA